VGKLCAVREKNHGMGQTKQERTSYAYAKSKPETHACFRNTSPTKGKGVADRKPIQGELMTEEACRLSFFIVELTRTKYRKHVCLGKQEKHQ